MPITAVILYFKGMILLGFPFSTQRNVGGFGCKRKEGEIFSGKDYVYMFKVWKNDGDRSGDL
jgi:hypothetical protein